MSLNIDPNEVSKFERHAMRWWDPEGEFKPLHEINPLRLSYIDRRCGGLANKHVIDVGCGGGILAESMVRLGATVTGIDVTDLALATARLHALEIGIDVNYLQLTAEEFSAQQPHAFDVVTCMELLEHVPDPASLVSACAKLAKRNGQIFFSTLNRNPKSYLLAVLGAEYLLHMLPRGTHDYAKFIRPAEMSRWLRKAHLEARHVQGLSYNPLTRRYRLSNDISVNYMLYATADSV